MSKSITQMAEPITQVANSMSYDNGWSGSNDYSSVTQVSQAPSVSAVLTSWADSSMSVNVTRRSGGTSSSYHSRWTGSSSSSYDSGWSYITPVAVTVAVAKVADS